MSPPRPSHSSLVLAALVLLTGCPADDTPADTDATESSSTSGSSTDGGPNPDPDTTAAESSSSSTTAVADETTTTGDPDTTTGDPPPAGSCAGLSQVGDIATVYSRDGMPIDTTCEPTPAPCGGDPLGAWAIEATCGFEALPNPLEPQCPGSTFVLEITSQTGTLTFEADGSFLQDLDIQSQVLFTLDPMACFGIDCAGFESIIQMDTPAATCQSMGPSCECVIPDDGAPEQTMGTWEVVGTDLVITTAEGPAAIPFCIAGDRLDQWQPLYDVPVATETACMDEQDCVDALGDMYDVYVCVLDEMPGG